MNPQDPVYIAGYIRVSGNRKSNAGDSLSWQRNTIEGYAAAQSFDIYRIYSDKNVSGAKRRRPGLDEMMRDGGQHSFQKVVFTSLDRFGRSAVDTLNNYNYFEKLGITLLSIKEAVDTSTSVGRLLRTLLAAMAEMERERTFERCTGGLLRRLENGLRIGGVVPYGYYWDKENLKIDVDADKAKIYRRIVHEYLSEKKSMTRIAQDLNLDEVPTGRGKKWRMSGIRLLLWNETYKGTWSYTFSGKRFRFPCPPLISPSTWKQVRSRISCIKKSWAERKYDPKTDPFFLRGLLRCGECGHGVHPQTTRARGQTHRYYLCYVTSKHRSRTGNFYRPCECHLPSLPATDIETVVLLGIVKEVKDPVNVLHLWRIEDILFEKSLLHEELTEKRIRLGHLESKTNQAWKLFEDNLINRNELVRRIKSGKKPIRDLTVC